MNPLIIAPVLLPALLAGVIILFARNALAVQRGVSLVGTLALLGIAVLLLQAPTQAYFLGAWPAPFGIVLVLDRLSALMLVLTAGLSLIVLIHALASGLDRQGKHFHPLFLFQLMGLNGAFLTGDAFNLFVFFEILLIASYGLMIHGGGEARLRAGIQYVAVNLLGSALFLFALAAIYAVTGTLNMADLAGKVASLPAGDTALIRVAGVLLLLVFAIKAALVPLHFWLPGTYTNAPPAVAALFAIMTKVGAYATIRIITLIFPPTGPMGDLVTSVMTPAALITVALGAIGTLSARSLPRITAFAAIASMGTIFLALAQQTPQATAAALYYMLHSTLATAALFLLPRRAGLFFAAAIAMAGLPPLSGFVGKLLILSAIPSPLGWSVVLLASLASLIGFARLGSDLFWKSPQPDTAPVIGPVLALGALAALTIFAGPITAALTQTATDLFAPQAYIAAALPVAP